MTRLRSPFWAALFVFALAVVVWIGNQSSPVQTQELERVLEIERYPNGPLELVKLSIGRRSVKDQIKQKFKDDQSKWAIDSVKFKEKDDWVKRLSITFRNASDKPIYGLQGLLFFKPVGFSMMFSLQLTHSKQLRREPLQPGAEIDGNLFRYGAKVQNTPNTRISRWAWEVFLVRDRNFIGRYGFDQVEWTPTGSMHEWLRKMAE